MRPRVLGVLLLSAVLLQGIHLIGQTESLQTVLPPDGIPSIDQAQFERSAQTPCLSTMSR